MARSSGSSKKKTKKKSSRKAAEPTWRERIADRLAEISESLEERQIGTGLRVGVWVVAIGALVIGGSIWVPRLQAAVAETSMERQAAESASALTVEITDAPKWYSGSLRSAMEASVFGIVGTNPFDRDGLTAARDALMQSGLFSEVTQVRRLDEHTITVDATFRYPFALVNWDGESLMIDDDGWLMPRGFVPGPDVHFAEIRGVAYPPPDVGGHWDGGDIPAAISVIRLIARKPWYSQVSAIDVTGYGAEGRLVLRTDLGAELIWQSPPGSERAGEVSAIEKIKRLDYLYERAGRIDDLYDGVIDLSDPGAIWARD